MTPPQSTAAATGAPGSWQTTETRHLRIRWRADESAPAEIDAAATLGEDLFTAIGEIVGAANTPGTRVTVLLEGDATAAGDGAGPSRNGFRIPHVDRNGRVHLYRYPHGYLEPLGHELVHAFRVLTGHWKGGFFEEGFASLIGDTVQPGRRGFPLYGHALTIVAGQWLQRAEALPMAQLLQRHRELSLRCMAQSYSLRASFFRFLAERHGMDTVLTLAHDGRPFDAASFERTFGDRLSSVESSWHADLLDRFNAIPDATERATRYRQESPVRFWEVCDA